MQRRGTNLGVYMLRQSCSVSRKRQLAVLRRLRHTVGYQAIGSFHSDNLGALMALSDEDYHAPTLPFLQDTAPVSGESDFMLDRDAFTFLNHGAFGAALAVGYKRAEQWRGYLEKQPLRFFDRDLLPHLAYATRRLALFCSGPGGTTTNDVRQGITLIQNATQGLNSVVRGFKRVYGSEAHVVVWDTSYGSLKKLAAHVVGPERVLEIPFQNQYLPNFRRTSDPTNVFLQALDDTLAKSATIKVHGTPFLLVIDHTTSNTAINMPIHAIAKHVKATYGDDKAKVLVDGAHGLLAQNVVLQDLASSGIDFYVANGHKWLSCPRGVGMLFCPSADLQDTILAEPVVISHGVDEPDLLSRFVWDGCRDYAAALALPAVLDYWEARNPGSIRDAMRQGLLQGIQRLADHWHDGVGADDWWESGHLLVPPTLISPMALVRLPPTVCGSQRDAKTSVDAKRVQDFLFDNRVEAPIKCINGKLYVRVSCHTYNEVNDFDRLGRVLLNYQR